MLPFQGPYGLSIPLQQPLYLTGVPLDGWIPMDYIQFVCTATDAPIYTVAALADVTLTPLPIGVGMKMRCKQNGVTIYGNVHALGAYNGSTLMQIYCGTDYSFTSFAQITDVYFTLPKTAGYGFPLNPDKWTVSTITTNTPTKLTPTAANWYGGVLLSPTGPSIDLPIGVWRVVYRTIAEVNITLAIVGNAGCRVTLSTANNSESDTELSGTFTVTLPIGTDIQRAEYTAEKVIAVTSKTTYYLNILTGSASAASILFTSSNIIKAIDTYL